jgi:hypothetical protein
LRCRVFAWRNWYTPASAVGMENGGSRLRIRSGEFA